MRDRTKKAGWILRIGVCCAALLLLLAVILSIPRRESEPRAEFRYLKTVNPDSAVLTVGSRWRGMLQITEHKGKGTLTNGNYPIWGRIDSVPGGTYFELYDEADSTGEAPILSLWVRLDTDGIVPLIGWHDARYYDIWLDERDVEAFTLKFENGGLSQSYIYNDGNETCRIEFHIKPEKST